MCILNHRQQFLQLVEELKVCGYLESEIYAIARINGYQIDSVEEGRLIEGIGVMQKQLAFAKKCLKVI